MPDRLRRISLITAVALGCALSAFQILRGVRTPLSLSPGAAARVNGHLIDADSVNRTVAGMGSRDHRSGDAATRHDVLFRMIDEELLVQHALDSGAAQTSPEVRAALVRTAIARLNAETAAQPITEHELETYFEAHSQVYAAPGWFEVTPFYFESAQFPDLALAQARATQARARLESGAAVSDVLGEADTLAFVPPDQLASVRTLSTYFGPEITSQVQQLNPGSLSSPVAFGHGVLFVRLNQAVIPAAPDLRSVRDLVLADAMRERQELALEKLLASLRAGARIELAARTTE